MEDTPRSNRFHVAFFGRTNSGKSTLLNTLAGQAVSIVSPISGTTTDPVYRPMELLPIGPVVLIDTAGLDDATSLGSLRTEKTREVARKTDLAVLGRFLLHDGFFRGGALPYPLKRARRENGLRRQPHG